MKWTIALLFFQPKSSVSRCYINKTKPGASSSLLGWALNMTVTCYCTSVLLHCNCQARIDFSKSNDLILLGDADETVNKPHWLIVTASYFPPQVTRLCEAAGWSEELAGVEVETLEALVKGQAWHQAQINGSSLWSLSNQEAWTDWKLEWDHTILVQNRDGYSEISLVL